MPFSRTLTLYPSVPHQQLYIYRPVKFHSQTWKSTAKGMLFRMAPLRLKKPAMIRRPLQLLRIEIKGPLVWAYPLLQASNQFSHESSTGLPSTPFPTSPSSLDRPVTLSSWPQSCTCRVKARASWNENEGLESETRCSMGLRGALRASLKPALVTWMWLKVGGDRLLLLLINFAMFAPRTKVCCDLMENFLPFTHS